MQSRRYCVHIAHRVPAADPHCPRASRERNPVGVQSQWIACPLNQRSAQHLNEANALSTPEAYTGEEIRGHEGSRVAQTIAIVNAMAVAPGDTVNGFPFDASDQPLVAVSVHFTIRFLYFRRNCFYLATLQQIFLRVVQYGNYR